MMIHRTRIVTFPRSGHHWLIRLLRHALGDSMIYAEYHQDGGTLENNASFNLQKDHDFDLSTPIVPEFHHLVQIRAFDPAMASWRKLLEEEKRMPWGLSHFKSIRRPYYDGFRKKWIEGDVPNRLIVEYEALCQHPVATLTSVLQHITLMGQSESMLRSIDAVLQEPPK